MDFPTNHYVWRAQQRAGAKPDVVSSDDGIRVHPERYVERIGDQTALVNVNRVLYSSSWIVDLVPIVAAAHEAGALVLVDDYHGSGVLPIDVHALDVDILVSGALKWICGGQGIAFLYCRRDLIPTLDPRVVGWFGAKDFFSFDASDLRLRDDARRFETGTFALPQAWTAAAALSLILEVGVDTIRARNQELTGSIVEHAGRLGLEVLSPTVDGERGGLVRVRVPGGTAGAAGLLKELFERDVVLDRRGDAFRISPHFFNDEDDLERCFRVLADLL
jgi:selenocysteine lyase/cysteine desulfurase